MTGAPKRRSRRKPQVVSLFGSAPPVPHVVPEVVEGLEDILRMARDGLVVGFAYATVEANGNVGTGWRGTADRHRLIHSVDYLHHRMLCAEAEDP